MDFLSEHWGNLFSVIGVVVSVAGLAWAVIEARGARAAAQAAKEATVETRDSIGRHLLTIDMERATNLIQRLKLLHSIGRWEAALEQYQALRAMLSSIIARYPMDDPELVVPLSDARDNITNIEQYVEEKLRQGLETHDVVSLNKQLNDIQSAIEDMSNSMELGG